MPPKRKSGAGNSHDERAAKTNASYVGTPQSIDSDDDFSDAGSDDEQESRAKAVQRFSLHSGHQSKSKLFKNDEGKMRIRDLSDLSLKSDHQNRPLWIEPDGAKIYLESFNPLAKYAQDFLTSIAEPLSRPSHIHEYAISIHSLYMAMSVGLTANDVINGLNKLLKTPLPPHMIEFIQESTRLYGKIKLVLKHNKYFLETSDALILQQILKDPELAEAGLGRGDITIESAPKVAGMTIPGTGNADGLKDTANSSNTQRGSNVGNQEDAFIEAIRADEDEDEEDEGRMIHTIEVPKQSIQTVSRRCLALGYPALEEYDFNNDQVNPRLEIDLKPGTKIRDYQEKSLSKMFSNGRARNGIIVLPCGAGKTLVGVTAACTIRRSVIVLCTSEMSVVQWRNEFLKWSNISPDDIATFTATNKQKFSKQAGIIVATYHMVTYSSGKRSHEAQKMMDFLQEREWGLMLLDEVHVVPAEMFRKVGSAILAHSKLGLTATLLREDNKITDLNFLIGPKLYEANWMELSNQGHIARVQCAEVWCPMTAEFYTEYLREKSRKRGLLCIMNPRKLQACQFLIDYHEKRGDKIIVFSDNVYALERYATKLGKAYIYGETSQNERMKILDNFQHNDQVNTIFLSKIGDTSLDLPEATCLIQVSSHYASRRQEAQRLGRILRAKRRNDEGFNAFFYSLVSKDTEEMKYSSKRQAFLVDQGYAFKVITHLRGIEHLPNLAYSTPREQRELLQEVLLQNESAADQEDVQGDLFSRANRVGIKRGGRGRGRRQAGTLSDLSGGQDMAYIEYAKSKNKELAKAGKGKSLAEKLRAQTSQEKSRRLNLANK